MSHLQSLPPRWETWMWAGGRGAVCKGTQLKHIPQTPLPSGCAEASGFRPLCYSGTASSCSGKRHQKKKKKEKSHAKNSTFCKKSSTTPKLKMFASTANICQHIFDFLPKYSGQNLGEKLRIVYGKQILLMKIFI